MHWSPSSENCRRDPRDDAEARPRNGKLVEQGTRDEILRGAKDPYTQRLIAAVPLPDPVKQRENREQRLAARL